MCSQGFKHVGNDKIDPPTQECTPRSPSSSSSTSSPFSSSSPRLNSESASSATQLILDSLFALCKIIGEFAILTETSMACLREDEDADSVDDDMDDDLDEKVRC